MKIKSDKEHTIEVFGTGSPKCFGEILECVIDKKVQCRCVELPLFHTLTCTLAIAIYTTLFLWPSGQTSSI